MELSQVICAIAIEHLVMKITLLKLTSHALDLQGMIMNL